MQGRKPTRAEWKILESNNLDSTKWLVQKSCPTFMQLISKTKDKQGQYKVITVEK